jgi:hypothetical protein
MLVWLPRSGIGGRLHHAVRRCLSPRHRVSLMPTPSKIAAIGACGLWMVTRTALAREHSALG